jgi:hypothetical protein
MANEFKIKNGAIIDGQTSIGTSSPDASAILHLQSTTQGFLPPVMTGGEREAIVSPAKGLITYDIDDNKLFCWDGSSWRVIAFA